MIIGALILFALIQPVRAAPVRLIFDTDMGNDIDDALALAVIHALESRGECKLLAVTLTKDNPWSAPFVDIVNHFYGRGSVPIGVVKTGKTPEDSRYLVETVQKKLPNGQAAFTRALKDGREAPDAVIVLRRVLAGEEDASVTIVQVGFSTNLARLLHSPPDEFTPLAGRELVARKVRLLSVMAGEFPPAKAEYNIKMDREAAARIFSEWPTPIVVSGFEIGKSILYPAVSIEKDFGYVEQHPIAVAYRAYQQMPYDRPTWDLTSVLYAVRPQRWYFRLSNPGTVHVDEKAFTHFREHAGGKHRYLMVDDLQRARVLEALTLLASQPAPGHLRK